MSFIQFSCLSCQRTFVNTCSKDFCIENVRKNQTILKTLQMSSEWCQIWLTKWYDNDKRPPSVLTIWQEIQRSWHTSYFGL